jgi:hypothetical protein
VESFQLVELALKSNSNSGSARDPRGPAQEIVHKLRTWPDEMKCLAAPFYFSTLTTFIGHGSSVDPLRCDHSIKSLAFFPMNSCGALKLFEPCERF